YQQAIEVEGLVVTGEAGQARRREIGNSIAQITSAKFENLPVLDVGDVLAGRAQGTIVQQSTGMVGAGQTIRIRGNNSVSQGNRPLVYVDGIRINSDPFAGGNSGADADEARQAVSPLNDINPMDIDRIEVVKGAAATTLYGTEASGGVIQIFTKSGTAGAPRWTLQVTQGWHELGPTRLDEIDPEGPGRGLGLLDCTDRPGCPKSGSFLRNGYVQRYNASVRGGSGDLTYFLSGQWNSEEGIIAPQGNEDYSIRGNFTFSPLDDLTFQFNNNYAHRAVQFIPDGNNADGLLLNLFRGPRGYTPNNNDSLPLEMQLHQTTDHFTTGVTTIWTPAPGITNRLSAGLDWSEADYEEELPFQYFRDLEGSREDDRARVRNFTLDYSGNWETDLTADVSSRFTWGGQIFDEDIVVLNGFGEDFAGPGAKVITSAAQTEVFSERRLRETTGGFFFQERLGWKDRAFVTLGLRVDGNSAFGDDFGFEAYPKIQGTYMVSDHSFWPSWWNTMKLRAAWGESGKAPGVFDAIRTFSSIAGDNGRPGVTPSNLGNPDLGPERSREFELGFEGTAWDSRVSFEFTYYDQKTEDALIAVQEPPSKGFVAPQLRNVGTISVDGIEAGLNVSVIRRQNFQWDVGSNYSTNNSLVESLGGAGRIAPNGSTWDLWIIEGQPLPVIFGRYPTNAKEKGVAPVLEDQALGPVYPTDNWSIDTRMVINRRLTFDALGEAQWGHWLASGTARQNVRRDQWPECDAIRAKIDAGDIADLTALQQARCASNPRYATWASPAGFFKLRQVSASYRLPESWLPGTVRSATVRASARNLFTITDYPGVDPEAVDSGSQDDVLWRVEYYNLPPARSFLFSLTLNF
ncbi:MAG: hypothetical protein D6701_09210, partial [Gemmatimonadetes bacterium]